MKYELLLALLMAAGSLTAATLPDSTRITRSTEYQDRNLLRSTSPEGATYRVEVTLIDSMRAVERLYDVSNGKLYSYQTFLNRTPRVRHGAYLEFYEDGKTRLQEAYVLGQVQGERRTYYPSGTLRRREQVTPNERTTGECFSPDGQVVSYFPYMELPVYPGGQPALLEAIGRNTLYPAEALRARIEGIVFVNFIVGKDGKLEEVKAEELPTGASAASRRTYSYLQKAAVRSVSKLHQFTPGRREGEPVAVHFRVPATFKIQ